MFEQDALGAAVAFAEGVHHVEVAKQFCAGDDQIGSIKLLKPVGAGQRFEQFVGFRLDAAGDTKVGVIFGDVDGAQFAGPVVEVAEQLSVDGLQVGEVVGRWGEKSMDSAATSDRSRSACAKVFASVRFRRLRSTVLPGGQ